jgi:hypothetical protein
MADYSFLEKLLHRLALGSDLVPEMTFDIEKGRYLKQCENVSEGRHVFVAGLARAGTTVLMRSLYQTGEFASLTYRDMPFVLAPNTWSGVSGSSKQIEARERAHGDNILVDFDSPEALEEVFWRVFCGNQYLKRDQLVPHKANAVVKEDFQSYISLILLKYGGQRYLSKNNNNILRLPSILEAFPDAVVLVPYREPLQHASSLLKQHQLFRERHAEDPFSKKYMQWLVHHEFGSDHRPFVFDGNPVSEWNADTVEYWLELWIQVYRYLDSMAQNESRIRFVCYESLCQQTGDAWDELFVGWWASRPGLKLRISVFPDRVLSRLTRCLWIRRQPFIRRFPASDSRFHADFLPDLVVSALFPGCCFLRQFPSFTMV